MKYKRLECGGPDIKTVIKEAHEVFETPQEAVDFLGEKKALEYLNWMYTMDQEKKIREYAPPKKDDMIQSLKKKK